MLLRRMRPHLCLVPLQLPPRPPGVPLRAATLEVGFPELKAHVQLRAAAAAPRSPGPQQLPATLDGWRGRCLAGYTKRDVHGELGAVSAKAVYCACTQLHWYEAGNARRMCTVVP